MVLTGLKFLCATFVFLAGSGATYQYVGTKIDEKKYLPIGMMVDIGGYELHVVDQGSGGPTVVIDSGVGCNCLDWSLVQPEIAKFARVISYDRAGYAWSDESPLDRTNDNIVEELRMLLQVIGAPGPYILVGHSFGGSNMQLYAMKHPNEVVGIVLVDSVHQDQLRVIKIPPMKFFHLLTGATSLGFFRLLSNIPSVQSSVDAHIDKIPCNVQDLYLSQKMKTKFIKAVRGEAFHAEISCNQLKLYDQLFEDQLLTVISAGKPFMSYERAQGLYTCDQVDKMNFQWPELQKDLVNKSPNGKHVVAEDSGHMIPLDRPDIIVQVVQDMINELNLFVTL